MKICSKCKIEKETDSFYREKSSSDGFGCYCKDCSKKAAKDRYWENPSKKRSYSKKYREENKEKVEAYNKKYFQENKEYFYAKKAEEIAKDPEGHKAKRREYIKRTHDNHREKANAWRKGNPAFLAKASANGAKRKAMKMNATPIWANKQRIQDYYDLAQYLTSEGEEHHVDHVIPMKHDLVCGLHNQFNLNVIPAKMNLVKHNKFEVV